MSSVGGDRFLFRHAGEQTRVLRGIESNAVSNQSNRPVLGLRTNPRPGCRRRAKREAGSARDGSRADAA